MTDDLDPEQEAQEDQYEFPYHYIPTFDESFSQTRHWSWGFRYLGGIQVLFDILDEIKFDRLVDVGCGDGRVLRELSNKYRNADFIGIDYSDRAIEFANVLNPELSFRAVDIRNAGFNTGFDVATAIEVLEHIPPNELDSLLASISDALVGDGVFIATVPHSNTSVNPKHYQHFSEVELREYLSPHFDNIRIIPIDARRKSLSLLQKIIGGNGKHFLITDQSITSKFWKVYKRLYLYSNTKYCGRLAAICRGPAD
jgi:SAM-dependent methyltransferase